MSDVLRQHLAAADRMLAGHGHPDNNRAGIRGPRAHDIEYMLACGKQTIPPNNEWLVKAIQGDDDE